MESVNKIEIIFSFLLILSLFLLMACGVKYIDYVTTFKITGQVIERYSEKSIKNINIIFIDQGFDDNRNKRKEPMIIGKSNHDGSILLNFDLWWGRTLRIISTEPSKKFTIQLSGKEFESKFINFSVSELNEKDGIVQVPLDTVYLNRLSQ